MQRRLASILLLSSAVAGGNATLAQEAAKPDRTATINYINNVIGKSVGAAITQMEFGNVPIRSLRLSYEPGSKSYSVVLEQYAEFSTPRGLAVAKSLQTRSGWTLRNLDALEDLDAQVSNGASSWTSGELRRIKLSFRAESVREVFWTQAFAEGRWQPAITLFNGTRNFVSFFYRAGDPDDSKRLRNALLRLKEIDAAEVDPFLN